MSEAKFLSRHAACRGRIGDLVIIVARCVRESVNTCEIAGRADLGGVLVTPRLLTCKELRGDRATYTHSGKRNRRVFTQSREERELVRNLVVSDESPSPEETTDLVHCLVHPGAARFVLSR